MIRSIFRSLLLLSITSAIGCAGGPIDAKASRDPGLERIATAFTKLVDDAYADKSVRWVSGWDGNDLVKESKDGKTIGLCWQWQEHVWLSLLPMIRRESWRAAKININRDWFSEHNAVAIWDPRKSGRDLSLNPPTEGAYVLDPWVNGKAEIYRLADWINFPVITWEGPHIEMSSP